MIEELKKKRKGSTIQIWPVGIRQIQEGVDMLQNNKENN